MKAILITSNGCQPCENLKEQFSDLLKSGEIVEKNFERDPDEVIQLLEKHSAGIPSLLILSDKGELIISI